MWVFPTLKQLFDTPRCPITCPGLRSPSHKASSDTSCKLKLSLVLLGSHSRLEISTTLVFGSINLLGETFYLLDHQFIVKGYNSGIANWKRCTGQDTGGGMEFLSPQLSPNHYLFTRSSLTLSFCILMAVSLYGTIVQLIRLWWLNSTFSSSEVGWNGAESSHLPVTWLVLLVTSPHP